MRSLQKAVCGNVFLVTLLFYVMHATVTKADNICSECHAEQVEQWRQSHHFHANATADSKINLGNFDNQTLKDQGKIIRFFRKNDKPFIAMPNVQGEMTEYRVAHTFGYVPLQQYTFETTAGKFQFFPYAWDSRPKEQGGQRWFNLYPQMATHDEFHWSQMGQNWNQMCVECHVTDYKKNYNAQNGTYAPGYSANNVSCDACHGNSDAHLNWASGDRNGEDKGYAVYIGPKTQMFIPDDKGTLQSIGELKPSQQINSCASCHSRRFAVKDRAKPHDFYDQYLPSLLTAELYHLDGQIWDEDYVWGSFLQSAKYQAGVTCTNCHNPHSGQLKIADNGLCTQCHGNEPYNQKQHHGHQAGTAGSACVDCHMPATVYMAVDARRDHSFQIPRPDLTLEMGVPNACNRCHEDKSPEWAVSEIAKWHPQPKHQGQPHFAQVFFQADRSLPGADAALTKIAQDVNRPAIVRATALDRMASTPGRNAVVAISRAVRESDPLMRQAAINAAMPYAPEDRWRMTKDLIKDPRLPIRTEAARGLAALLIANPSPLSAEEKKQLELVLEEYREVQHYQADRGFAHTNLGNLARDLGEAKKAEKYYRDAIGVEPIYMPAYVNLSELYRQQGNEIAAQKILQQALAINPQANRINYALGMSLVRQGQKQSALGFLKAAATTGIPDVDMIYAYALLLQDQNKHTEALEQLLKIYAQTPGNPDINYSLSQAYLAEKNYQQAVFYARQLAQLVPNNPQLEAMVEQIEALAAGQAR